MHSNISTEQIQILVNGIGMQAPLLFERISSAIGTDCPQSYLCEVLKFLTLVSESEQRLTPAVKIDLAWHELILFTRIYASLCDELFGRFIHHSPGGDEGDNKAQFEYTLSLYNSRFGKIPNEWGLENSECGSCST